MSAGFDVTELAVDMDLSNRGVGQTATTGTPSRVSRPSVDGQRMYSQRIKRAAGPATQMSPHMSAGAPPSR
jgi:hypothetical protein